MSTSSTAQQRAAASTTASDPYQLQTQQYLRQRQFQVLQQRWQAGQIQQQQQLLQQQQQNQYPSSLQERHPPLQQQQHMQFSKNDTPGTTTSNTQATLHQSSNISHPLPTPTAALPKSLQNGHPTGQAVLRLIQLGDFLTPGKRASYRSFWDGFVQDFFAQDSKLLFGLWNTLTKEQEHFEICQPLVARFFHTQYECQVTSIKLTMDQTMEYILPQGMMVECPISSFIYRYDNDTMVVLTGRTSIILRMDAAQGNLKIQQWDFACHHVEEFISRYGIVDAVSTPPTPPVITTKKKGKQHQQPKAIGKQVPDSLVNEYGLPHRVYSLLKMSNAMSKHGENALVTLLTTASQQHQRLQQLQQHRNGIKEEAMSPSPMNDPLFSATPELPEAEPIMESPITTKREAKRPKQAKKKRTSTPTRKISKPSTAVAVPPAPPPPTTNPPSLDMRPPSSPMLMNNVSQQHMELLSFQQRQVLILQQQQQQQQPQHIFQVQHHHMQMQQQQQQQQQQATPSSPYPQGTTYPSSSNSNIITPATSTIVSSMLP